MVVLSDFKGLLRRENGGRGSVVDGYQSGEAEIGRK